MTREPLTEDLSAYIDGELRGTERAELEQHLAGCETCRRRLDQLRGSVNAIRALPMETAPRAFTVPAQRRQQLSELAWGRIGRFAAAVAAFAIAVTAVGFLLSRIPSPEGRAGGAASAPRVATGQQNRHSGDTAVSAPFEQPRPIYANSTTVSDRTDPTRRLTLETDSARYHSTQAMGVRAVLTGSTSQPVAGRIEVVLSRNGQAQVLMSNFNIQPNSNVQPLKGAIFNGSFPISSLPPVQQGPGTYTLVATWTYPDGRRALVAQLQIQVES